MNNNFSGLKQFLITHDRHTQLAKMMDFLAKRKPCEYRVVHEEFMEGMCYHFSLISNGDIVAKLVSDFNKVYYYYENQSLDVMLEPKEAKANS